MRRSILALDVIDVIARENIKRPRITEHDERISL